MAKPFVKWAGGKNQLLTQIDKVINDIRVSSDSFIYVEPFVGGGSVLFHILSTCSNLKYAVINDANVQLMTCYKVIADNVGYIMLKSALIDIQNEYNSSDDKEGFYKARRKEYNEWVKGANISDVDGAKLFIFLNKCGFNGLYRVNKKGEFNVPWGKKKSLNIFDNNNLDECHILLSDKVVILCGDYTSTDFVTNLARVENCNVIYYLDPPYKPVSKTATFTTYTKDDFRDEDQIALKKFCDGIVQKGGDFVLSNSKCDDFFEVLYDGYNISTVSAKRNINSVGSKRGVVDELIISSHDSSNQRYYFTCI